MEVEIWSDIACPWCYVGKRRFESAMARFDDRETVRVTWRSFELDPAAPVEREGDGAAHLAEKYATTREQAVDMQESMTTTAARDGLDFRFDLARSGNTFDAHRVLHLAAARGVQDAVKERFMRAYLTEGELMGDHATLLRLAQEAGLSADELRDLLAGDRYAEEVRQDERTAASIGISAVPFFVVDRKFGASGAQPPDALLALLRTGSDARPAALDVVASGAACGPDGC
ncbi:MAG: DsbA family oxidoreductase [Thermoleophilaceae bacterium]